MHTHDEVLVEVRVTLGDAAADVSQCYPDDDNQWWVEDASHSVFAYAWYDGDAVLHIKDYRP